MSQFPSDPYDKAATPGAEPDLETLRHAPPAVPGRAWHPAVVPALLIGLLTLLCALVALFAPWHSAPKTVDGSAQAETSSQTRSKEDTALAPERQYVAAMAGATDDMLRHREAAVRAMLAGQLPASGTPDLRNWEWYYADTVLNPGVEKVTVSDRPLRAMAVSPDDLRVAVAGDDGKISIWTTAPFQKVASWEAVGGAVNGLSWNDKDQLAAALNDGSVAVWEVARKLPIARWQAHAQKTTCLLWQPHTGVLITGGADGVVSEWKASGEPIHASQCKGSVLAMDMRHDGRELAVMLSNPFRVIVGKPDVIEKVHEVQTSGGGSALAWQPFDEGLLLSFHGMPARLWNPYNSSESEGISNQLTPGVTTFAWSPQGQAMAMGAVDGGILLASAGLTNINMLYGHQGPVRSLHWLARRDRLLSIGEDGTLRAWDQPRRPANVFTLTLPAIITAAQWNPRRDRLAVLLANDEVQVLDGTSRRVLWTQVLPRPASLDSPMSQGLLAWNPEGTLLAVGCRGRALSVLQAEDGSRAHRYEAIMAEKGGWMPDGKRLLLKEAEGWFTLAPDGAHEKLDLPASTEWVAPLRDGRIASLGVESGTLRARVVGETSAVFDVPDMRSIISCTAVSADFNQIAVGLENGSVAWFDARTNRWARPAMTHAGTALALGWNGDGSRLASVGTDMTCRLYNVKLVAQNWVIRYDMNPAVVSVGWNSRGDKLMVVNSPESQIKVFDAGRAMDREPTLARPPVADHRFADACAAINRNPGDSVVWKTFSDLIKQGPKESVILAAAGLQLTDAAELGEKALFERPVKTGRSKGHIMTEWEGQPLPLPVQILQACLLEQWDEAATLSAGQPASTQTAAWMALALAEVQNLQGLKPEAEKSWARHWNLQRHESVSDAELPLTLPEDTHSDGHCPLSPWANVLLDDDWTGGENNNLVELPATVPQPALGFTFATGPFIQLAGKTFRATHQRMYPRLTDWIPLGKTAHRVAFMIATACYHTPGTPLEGTPRGTCVGSLYVRREDGGVVRIPLIYGDNVWDWWVPSNDPMPAAPPSLVAWKGSNPRARLLKHDIALYRLEWEDMAGATTAAATDFSISSTMRRPAPMLLSAEVVR